ncbi:hypothetical protein [Streptomyces noursei]|uniref:hypothetical protein n=1 Tax=Streptomyces noursei TaxID=1971 RepID=UPI0022A68ACD|nr:hypothetical protein [Streptomyces noursei]MCZ1021267.1 hypothetical protein [Streptomyces noursei]
MDQPTTPQSGLVVPVKLSALVVNGDVLSRSNFQRWQLNFHRLNLHLNPEPAPFSDLASLTRDHEGIYLHWDLPNALRRGTHDADKDTTTFPVVPNRWLIVRRGGGIKMWVIESDHLGPKKATAHRRATSPFTWTGPDRVRRITHIGRALEVTQATPWAESPPPTEAWKPKPGTFLTAHGPGIPAFSHYQPYNENVFSFHDRLASREPTEFTYTVIGWYSDPTTDPLATATDPHKLQRILTELNWTQAQLPQITTAPAQHSYYAGMARKVRWHPKDPVEPDKATELRTQVAVGNSSLTALAAMVSHHSDQDPVLASSPLLLEALQYGMLDKIDQPDGMLDLGRQIHNHAFTSAPGGYHWRLVDTRETNAGPGPASALTREQSKTLADLNDAQVAYDTATRELHDLRRRLYDTWWLHSLPLLPRGLDRELLTRDLDPQADGSLAQRIGQEIQRIGNTTSPNPPPGSLAMRVKERKEKLHTLGIADAQHSLPTSTLLLKRVPDSPFHTPQDPVVLIRGAGMHEPMDTTPPLPCRPTEAIATQPPSDEHAATINSLLTDVPAPVRALAHESAWYTAHTQPPPGTIAPPEFVLRPWTQPWQPLYLEWEVRHHPIPHNTNNGKPNWTFDGDRYTWTPHSDDTTPSPITIAGRTLLSAHTAFNIAARLRQHAKAHPDKETRNRLERFADSTAHWDLLAQSLGGFTTQLTSHDQSRNVQPEGELRDLVGTGWRSAPDPGPLPVPFEGYPPSSFQQIRAGQFEFTQLKIIDRFGRAYAIIEKGQEAEWAPERTRDTTPSDQEQTELGGRGVHLRPRLLQGARLRFDLVDANNDGILVDHDPQADPVCGWLLPNHIDQALACYTPHGAALGELRSTTNPAGTTEVTWHALPTSPAPQLANLPTIGLAHLHRFLDTIRTNGTATLTAILNSLDGALGTVHPQNAHTDTTPATLAGRPLALVRSRLALELDSAPLTDPSWQYVLQRPTPQFPDYDWPVRLGERDRLGDGLLAYVHDDTTHIYGVHPSNDPSGCLQAITPPNYPTLKARHHPHLGKTPDPDALYLTLLIEPTAHIHANIGILPTTSLNLPTQFTQRALHTLEMFFRVGPLLTVTRTTTNKVPSTTLATPRPSMRVGNWNWIERNTDGTASTLPLTPADAQPRFTDNRPVIRNGLLTLTQGDTTHHRPESTSPSAPQYNEDDKDAPGENS